MANSQKISDEEKDIYRKLHHSKSLETTVRTSSDDKQ